MTEKTPKVLLPVAGRPLLAHQLQWLLEQGVDRVVLCLGHLAESVERFIRNSNWDDRIDIVVSNEGDRALGTAGAVRLAIERTLLSGSFLTLYGDCLPDMDLPGAMARWDESGLPAMLAVHEVVNEGLGAVARVEGDRVCFFSRETTSLDELHSLTHGDYGLAGFEDTSFAHLDVGVRAGFASIHQSLASRRELLAVIVPGGARELGSREGLAALQREMSTAPQSSVRQRS
jgi:NDP-sugar pyrophosphorylase family protein